MFCPAFSAVMLICAPDATESAQKASAVMMGRDNLIPSPFPLLLPSWSFTWLAGGTFARFAIKWIAYTFTFFANYFFISNHFNPLPPPKFCVIPAFWNSWQTNQPQPAPAPAQIETFNSAINIIFFILPPPPPLPTPSGTDYRLMFQGSNWTFGETSPALLLPTNPVTRR